MSELFTPPYPEPHVDKSTLLKRFIRGWNSWIHVLFAKSYTMKMGEIHVPRLSFYIVNELPLVKRIMAGARSEFPKHSFMRGILDPLIGNSVFSANGADWEEQRAMIDPAFSHAQLSRVFPDMAQAVDDIVARVAAMDLTGPVHVDPLMTHVAADIIYRTLFSRTLGEAEALRIHTAFQRYQRHSQSATMLHLYGLPTLGFRRRTAQAAAQIHAVFAPIVRARYDAYHQQDADHAAEQGDILAALLAARHAQTGAAFDFDQVMGQVTTIFLAGHETSASTLTWALYLLAECPHLQTAIRVEAEAAFDAGARYDGLRLLHKTRNVFREALRLYPPLSFLLREVTTPTEMRGKAMKPGAMLVVSPWLIQRNSDNWTCPHAFDPDRFDRPETKAAVRDAYLPFGKGPRICIGAGFAQQEALLVLPAFVRAFRLGPAPGAKPEPVSRLTLRPKHGVYLLFERRTPGHDAAH